MMRPLLLIVRIRGTFTVLILSRWRGKLNANAGGVNCCRTFERGNRCWYYLPFPCMEGEVKLYLLIWVDAVGDSGRAMRTSDRGRSCSSLRHFRAGGRCVAIPARQRPR